MASLLAAAVFALTVPDLAAASGKKEWITLQNCELIPNPDNDGDSFHVRSNGTEYLVRLYLVDAPETKGALMASRLIEQATYFGISVPQVIEVGKNAKSFVEKKLSQPFTVVTRMASGLGRSKIERFYGFVQTKDGDLGELLVANGLARVHGTHAAPPGSSSANEELDKLTKLEEKAKQTKAGGWSSGIGATANMPQPVQSISPAFSLPTPSPKPQAIAPVAPGQSISSSSSKITSAAPASGKLDVNIATKEQLEKIPGIGDSLSERIIAARPFKSADDLKKVKGVGEGKRYEQIRPYFQ